MKYTVSINEKNRTITVTLADGTKGVARCNPSDRFDINTGIELALERAKVAKTNASKPTPTEKPMGVMELVKALEKALPVGQMVVVGNGKEMTKQQKEWLATLAGVPNKCCCCDCNKDDDDYESGYDDGYADGYADAEADYDDSEVDKLDAALARIRDVLDEAGLN